METISINLYDLENHAAQAEIVTWQERQALRLEDGLAFAPGDGVMDGSIEVLVGTDGAAYSGIAFRIADILNFELAYAVPHVSGEWDALQYDPVFHGSNTWQLFHGLGYQQEAHVPTSRWFQLKVDFYGQPAIVSVDGQEPLMVTQLAHSIHTGKFGLWTFRPAYFSDLRITTDEGIAFPSVEVPSISEGTVKTWFLEEHGILACEPNGVTNLNRFLPMSMKKARLVRRFETAEAGEITFEFGFSDVLSLELDGDVIYKGENTFKGFDDRTARGYAEMGMETVRRELTAGEHKLVAELEVTEGFGWGLTLAAHGEALHWLPVEMG